MRGRLALAAFALLASCQRSAPPEPRTTDPRTLELLRETYVPESYARLEDQRAAARLRAGYQAPVPCASYSVDSRIPVSKSLPDDLCFKFAPAQRMQGLWRNEFEGSQFCAAPARRCSGSDHYPFEPGVASLQFARPASAIDGLYPGGLYAIDFVGRRTVFDGSYGYGFFSQEVIVDRLISIREVEPPPAMTKELPAGWKRCTAQGQCSDG